jgi:starvation-inducible DNA-binding protein
LAKRDKSKDAVIAALAKLLASTYTVYTKTHGFHWNVTGPHFNSLHTLFMAEYTELALAVDLIAERMRALGAIAPASYAAFAELSAVPEQRGAPKAIAMVKELAGDQQILVGVAQELLQAAEQAGDDASQDLAVQRLHVHQKNAWMLRSHLE